MNKHIRGFIVVIAIVLLGMVVFLYSNQSKQNTAEDKSNSQPSPVIASKENRFQVPELGISFATSNDLQGLVYLIDKGPNGEVSARFSTTSLNNIDSQNGGKYCSLDGGAGAMGKSSYLPNDISDYKKIGAFYYTYNHPQATCSDKNEVIQLQRKQAAALGEAFKTIELIK